jgi:hypothetical protein
MAQPMAHHNPKKWLWLDTLTKAVTLVSAVIAAFWTTYIYYDQRALEREGRITSIPKLAVGPPDAKGIAHGTFSLDITNTSKVDVEVSWVLVHWFRGSLSSRSTSVAWVANDPPDKFRELGDPEPIQWEVIDYKAFTYPGWTPPAEITRRFKYQPGGGTKHLRPGDSCNTSYEFFVDTAAMDFIGFSTSFGIDQKWWGDNLFHAAEAAPLTKLTSKETLKVVPANRSPESKERH